MTATLTPTNGGRIATLINTIVLARHGKAPKTSPDQRDEDRKLNELGISQAKKLGDKIRGLTFDFVLSSPLERASQTLLIATGGLCPIIIDCPELTCPTDGVHPIDVMFNAPDMSYVPLKKYFEHPLGEHLKVWGKTALETVLDALGNRFDLNVLVGGHAVLQNALAWALIDEFTFTGDSNSAMELVMNTNLGEGEAFKINLTGEGGHVVEAIHIKLD